MLTVNEIQEVKQEFCDLLRTIKRPDSDIEGLIAYLEELGFFKAPASAKYHCSFPGGLCLHSINVYQALQSIVDRFDNTSIKDDSVLIVGLLHDVIRANLFEEFSYSEKVYSDYGKKNEKYIDPLTNKEVTKYFDWATSTGFKVKEAEDRLTFGSRGFATYYIISQFISLTKEETITLVNQYNAFDNSNQADISAILSKYPLAVYLHSADTIATYCIEK